MRLVTGIAPPATLGRYYELSAASLGLTPFSGHRVRRLVLSE